MPKPLPPESLITPDSPEFRRMLVALHGQMNVSLNGFFGVELARTAMLGAEELRAGYAAGTPLDAPRRMTQMFSVASLLIDGEAPVMPGEELVVVHHEASVDQETEPGVRMLTTRFKDFMIGTAPEGTANEGRAIFRYSVSNECVVHKTTSTGAVRVDRDLPLGSETELPIDNPAVLALAEGIVSEQLRELPIKSLRFSDSYGLRPLSALALDHSGN